MEASSLATVIPSLEFFKPLAGKTIRANFNGTRVDSRGQPLPRDGEEVISRWGGLARLVVLMNEDGFGPRGGGEGKYSLVQVALGSLAIAVMEERLVGSFIKGTSFRGELVQGKRVLTFSWPYVDLQHVDLEAKSKMLGGTKYVQATIGSVAPLANLRLESAVPLNDSWTSAWVPKGDLSGFAEDVVVAAGSFIQDSADEEDPRLERGHRW